MNREFTKEQESYIFDDELCDTKLIASAGSGKTFTIIFRMQHLIGMNKMISYLC